MNNIYIYTKYKRYKLIKQANRLFNNKYLWYNSKCVFAPYSGTYTIAIHKNSIHISCWDEHTDKGKKEQLLLKKFLEDNLKNKKLVISYDNESDLILSLKINNIILKEEQK